MEIFKFKKIPGASLAAILHLQPAIESYWGGGGDKMGGGTNKSL